jgi:hypothetical protein
MGRGKKRRHGHAPLGLTVEPGVRTLPSGLGAALTTEAEGMRRRTLRLEVPLSDFDLDDLDTAKLIRPGYKAGLMLGPPALRIQMHMFSDRDKVLHAEPHASQLQALTQQRAKMLPVGHARLEATVIAFDGKTVTIECELDPLEFA